MFILKNSEQLKRANAKARRLRPVVKFDAFGKYRVSGSNGVFYVVICKRSDNGYRLVGCNCLGAQEGHVCYHASAALAVHTGLARLRQTA